MISTGSPWIPLLVSERRVRGQVSDVLSKLYFANRTRAPLYTWGRELPPSRILAALQRLLHRMRHLIQKESLWTSFFCLNRALPRCGRPRHRV